MMEITESSTQRSVGDRQVGVFQPLRLSHYGREHIDVPPECFEPQRDSRMVGRAIQMATLLHLPSLVFRAESKESPPSQEKTIKFPSSRTVPKN